MNSLELDPAIHNFQRQQRERRIVFTVLLLAVLASTVGTLAYVRNRARRVEAEAASQQLEFERLKEQAHLRYEMRTERRINRAEIMPQVSGEQQRLAIQAALNLYEQKPPIPFTWGGKSPSTGFDSSGFVAYVLTQAHVLSSPAGYWSDRLKQELKSVPIEQRRPGDILFYSGGTCMLYLGGSNNLSIGALPGGITTGDLDQYEKPQGVGRY